MGEIVCGDRLGHCSHLTGMKLILLVISLTVFFLSTISGRVVKQYEEVE